MEKHSIWHKKATSEEGKLKMWKPKGKIWFKHNDDAQLGNPNRERQRRAYNI